jgi:hypothetical protein
MRLPSAQKDTSQQRLKEVENKESDRGKKEGFSE